MGVTLGYFGMDWCLMRGRHISAGLIKCVCGGSYFEVCYVVHRGVIDVIDCDADL